MQNRGMELQLGLALSINPIKGFDLNDGYVKKKKKRSFDEAFEKQRMGMGMGMGMEMGDETLPLLVWGDQPQDNDDSEGLGSNSAIIDKGERDENGVVGWPPINSWRKKLCHHHHQSISGQATTILEVAVSGGGGGWRSNSTYVKVKMEGVAIGRKVDLSLHHSYETLTDTLIGMFGKWSGNGKAYELTYQDQEGDWLLAGDVPWGTFIQSVQRLKLQKNHN